MQVDLVEESPPATPVACETWVFVPRPIVLLTLHGATGWILTVFFFHSVTTWPLKQRVYKLEAWNDASPVGTVYLKLESVCHQLIGSVVARLCRAKRNAVSHWSSRPSTKEETRVRGASLGKSVDQRPGFSLSKNCFWCMIMLSQWKSCTKLTVFTNDHNT